MEDEDGAVVVWNDLIRARGVRCGGCDLCRPGGFDVRLILKFLYGCCSTRSW